jgi:ATPase family associated with various cellular activities (AAA)
MSDELEKAQRQSDLSDLVTVLRTRAPRVALAIAVAQAARPLYYRAKNWLDDRSVYTVTVRGDDDVYSFVHEWLLDLLPPNDHRALIATAQRRKRGAEYKYGIDLLYDGRYTCDIRVDGYKASVLVEEGRFATEGSEGGVYKPPQLQFTVSSAAARDAVIENLERLAEKIDEGDRQPTVKMYGDWGWETVSDEPVRPLGSVILPPGQVERIIADMQRFLDSESEYVRRGIPWHRGYLFSGPPRTGKTSMAKAIAGHFGMDLWYMPLSDVRKDGDLIKQVSRVSSRSILLLEDVDIYHAATGRDDKPEGRATLAGLLNATDGAATPHGLITILTSNQPGKLDDALIQPGRVDLHEEFGLCTDEQARRIVSHYYDGVSISSLGSFASLEGISPAAVQEACKRADSPREALDQLLRDKQQAMRATRVHDRQLETSE